MYVWLIDSVLMSSIVSATLDKVSKCSKCVTPENNPLSVRLENVWWRHQQTSRPTSFVVNHPVDFLHHKQRVKMPTALLLVQAQKMSKEHETDKLNSSLSSFLVICFTVFIFLHRRPEMTWQKKLKLTLKWMFLVIEFSTSPLKTCLL